MRPALALIAGCLALGSITLAYMAAYPVKNGSLDDETRAIASTLKCPVCHDLSVADSPAPVAAEMRAQIWNELQAGESPDQIRKKFVDAYGPSILLTPPARGVDLSLWAIPLLLALGALGLTLASIRRWTRHRIAPEGSTAPISDGDRDLLNRALSAEMTD